MDDHDLESWPDSELYRVVGILMCERMLYARDAEVEAEIDGKIAALEQEIAVRRGVAPTPPQDSGAA